MLFGHQLLVFSVASWSRPVCLIATESFSRFKYWSLQLDGWNLWMIIELVGCWARSLAVDKLGLVLVVVLWYVLLISDLSRKLIT